MCLSADFKWIINKSCLTFNINRSKYRYQVQQMQRLTQLWPLVGSACILVWYLNAFALMIMQSVRCVSDPRLCTQTRACRLTGHSVLLHARRTRNIVPPLIIQAWTTSICLYYWNDHTKYKAKILVIPICCYCSHRRPFHWSTIAHDRSWGTIWNQSQLLWTYAQRNVFMAKASTKMTTETQTMLTAIYYCRLVLLFVTINKLSLTA